MGKIMWWNLTFRSKVLWEPSLFIDHLTCGILYARALCFAPRTKTRGARLFPVYRIDNPLGNTCTSPPSSIHGTSFHFVAKGIKAFECGNINSPHATPGRSITYLVCSSWDECDTTPSTNATIQIPCTWNYGVVHIYSTKTYFYYRSRLPCTFCNLKPVPLRRSNPHDDRATVWSISLTAR